MREDRSIVCVERGYMCTSDWIRGVRWNVAYAHRKVEHASGIRIIMYVVVFE
jgi:hypothetical protein